VARGVDNVEPGVRMRWCKLVGWSRLVSGETSSAVSLGGPETQPCVDESLPKTGL